MAKVHIRDVGIFVHDKLVKTIKQTSKKKVAIEASYMCSAECHHDDILHVIAKDL